MLNHPNIDPVALAIGPLKIHWYGLMYVLAFTFFYFLGLRRVGRPPWEKWTRAHLDDLIFWGMVGVVVGGRLGFVLFYQSAYYSQNPLEIFAVWKGGMSFHGGLVGVIAVLWWWARRHGFKFMEVTDFVAPLVPTGLAAGRLGNFINGELPGRPTDVPWAMIFPHTDNIPRHPSQLYEFALEGIVLFLILWWFSSRRRPTSLVSAMFLLSYGLLRFLVEFTRQPDVYVGFLAGGLTMGQYLSLPMIVAGVIMIQWTNKTENKTKK